MKKLNISIGQAFDDSSDFYWKQKTFEDLHIPNMEILMWIFYVSANL